MKDLLSLNCSLQAYLLSVVWRCYRYLSLRRVSGRATVSVLGTPGLAELGPDYDLHPAAAASTAAPTLAPSTVALLNPPEYSKLKDLPPPPPPPPETPPPPYSSTLYLNRN